MATQSTRFDTTTNRDLLKEGTIRKLFDTTSESTPQYYKELVNDLTWDEYTFRDQRIGGLTPAGEIVEGEGIPLQIPVLGTSKTYTQRRFGTGFRMTEAMNRFNQYGLWQKNAKALGRMQKICKDEEVHVLFNDPTSIVLTCGVGYDTLALASNAHTGLLAGSTADNYDNLLSADLSTSALESAWYYFRTLIDDMGHLRSVIPSHLVFEPTLYFTASEIWKSSDKAHQLSNTTNVIPSAFKGLKLYEDPMLTSTTMWFMLAKGDDLFDINVFTAQEPDLVIGDAPDTTRDRMATSQQWFTYGWGDPRAYYLGKA